MSAGLLPLIREALARIPANESRLGVMVSGGFDSSLLLYYLLREVGTGRLRVFTVPRPDGALVHARRLTPVVCEMAGCNTIAPIPVGNPSLHHSMQTFSGIVQVLRENWVDYLLLAENVTPNDPDLKGDPWAPGRFRSKDRRMIQPFFDLTKDQLIAAAFADGLERLLMESHSCTERTQGRCGRCWQCRERAWAFARIDRVDPGLN